MLGARKEVAMGWDPSRNIFARPPEAVMEEAQAVYYATYSVAKKAHAQHSARFEMRPVLSGDSALHAPCGVS